MTTDTNAATAAIAVLDYWDLDTHNNRDYSGQVVIRVTEHNLTTIVAKINELVAAVNAMVSTDSDGKESQ